MTPQQQYELALLSLWYIRAENRKDAVGMASYRRKIIALYKAVYPEHFTKAGE